MIKDSKVLKVVMQSDLPLGLRNTPSQAKSMNYSCKHIIKVQSSHRSVDVAIGRMALKFLGI